MKPEEIVRQALLLEMTEKFGYPRELIGVEREISTLPHLKGALLKGVKIPKRRFDLVCFAGKIHKEFPLYPLLLIECKAIALSEKALQQVLGYNYYVGAYFVAIANGQGVVMCDRKGEIVRNGLMPYSELTRYAMDTREKSLSSV